VFVLVENLAYHCGWLLAGSFAAWSQGRFINRKKKMKSKVQSIYQACINININNQNGE